MGNVVSKRQAADVPQWRVNNTKNEYSFVIKSARLTNGKLLHLSRAYCIRAVSSRYAYTPTRLPRWKYFTITRIGLNEIPFNTPRAAWTFCSVCTALIMSTSRLADILPFTLYALRYGMDLISRYNPVNNNAIDTSPWSVY